MKLFHTANLHFRRESLLYIFGRAEEESAILTIAGNLLDGHRDADLDSECEIRLPTQAAWTTEQLARRRTPTFPVPGEHDIWLPNGIEDIGHSGLWLQKARRPGMVYVPGDAEKVCGFNFVCVPWDDFDELRVPNDDGAPSVVISAVPPAGTPVSQEDGADVGSHEFARTLGDFRPGSLFLTGTVHGGLGYQWWADFGHNSYAFSPGYNFDSLIPNFIEIDTITGFASYMVRGNAIDRIRFAPTQTVHR